MDVDDKTLDQLRAHVGMSREDARTLVKQEGLDGLRNRGLLLQFLDDNHIAPEPNPAKPVDRVRDELNERMEQRLKRWHTTS